MGQPPSIPDDGRTLGLVSATSVGVGAIVGGGILALAGVAFQTTGPSAILAFALNGIIAVLTALSFAEMASRFPESGGTYTFAKKVLSVEAAFSVGWVVWFASIVAGVLYAIGFAHFIAIPIVHWIPSTEATLNAPWAKKALAVGVTFLVGGILLIKSGGGGKITNLAKLIVFGLLVIAGIVATFQQPVAQTTTALKPFFEQGALGLVQAMGFTFIALQGFDLIAAVGGEVRDPAKTLPRAMLGSLFIALAIYLPLLFVVTVVGTDGAAIAEAAGANPEGIVADAALQYLGTSGYWLVVIGAILGMFSALEANIYAASRIAYSMARDRTLPALLSRLAGNRNPQVAVGFTSAMVIIVVLVVGDVATAGAASSLIFLLTFGLAHWLCFLIRKRSLTSPPPFRTPLFPLVPVLGGFCCFGLAIFQGFSVPSAGLIASAWLAVGGVLFVKLFSSRARIRDASMAANDPELVRLRGKSSLVLVPIANPDHVRPLLTLARSLVPKGVGRVLMQHVVVSPKDWDPNSAPLQLQNSNLVLSRSLETSARLQVRAEALTSIAEDPLKEIARVAELHLCQAIVMGLSHLPSDEKSDEPKKKNPQLPLESFLSNIDIDVVILRAPATASPVQENDVAEQLATRTNATESKWDLAQVERILVPVAGRGGHEYLMTKVLGSLGWSKRRQVTYVRVVPVGTPENEQRRFRRDMRELAEDQQLRDSQQKVVESDDALSTLSEMATDFDLIVLGVTRLGKGQRVLGSFTRRLATHTECPMLILSNRSLE